MKILLVGEYSGFHKNLRDGLIALGHECTVAGTSDGTKQIKVDTNFGSSRKGIIGKFQQLIRSFLFVWNASSYDVIQLINPIVFTKILFINKILVLHLIKKGKNVFLSSCGSDAYFIEIGEKRLKYSPMTDHLKYDLQATQHPRGGYQNLKWNSELVSYVDGIIPAMYEYALGYQQTDHVHPPIPLPINTESISFEENIVNDKIVVFHGLSRYGFKGTRHVEEAFSVLNKKYPDDVYCHIKGNLPISEYLQLMRNSNIVVDQTYFYSNGMNALYALAMGKIVLGGSEPEGLEAYGIDVKDCPVINITPDSESIISEIENLIRNRKSISEISQKSREYVQTYHNSRIVAAKYLDAWAYFS